MPTLPWIAATVGLLVLLGAFGAWAWASRRGGPRRPLPTEWALSARPVFTTDERRMYRLLREALPHQVILAKLPLVRLCQPSNPSDVRYWYQLLNSLHVGFAVCSTNGRVLAALDLDNNQGDGKRATKIKQSVLAACRIRYLRCESDRLPSVAELQLLVPQHATSARAPQASTTPSGTLDEARDTLASTVATRRAERVALWQDSTFFQDSFFALDSRLDPNSDFINLAGTTNGREPGTPNDSAAAAIETHPTRH
jgi:hypothetical protein